MKCSEEAHLAQETNEWLPGAEEWEQCGMIAGAFGVFLGGGRGDEEMFWNSVVVMVAHVCETNYKPPNFTL